MSTANTKPTGASAHKPKIGLILVVAAVIAGLAGLDLSLEQTEEAELQRSARHAYQSGSDLLKHGKVNEAVDALRRAHALERPNEEYELALVEALLAAGKIEEARPLMNEILQDDPDNGRANLIAARTMLKKNNTRAAEAFYHRAIYGDWPSNAKENRIAVRMELIEQLQKNGNQQELLAELLPLEEEASKDQNLKQKLAHLFLVAGSPARSAEMYREILQRDPNDAQAYAGLGEAELQLAQYRAAHGNFLEAWYHDPKDQEIRAKADLADTLASLDPTVRQLASSEKYSRCVKILDLARGDLQQCLTRQPSANSDAIQQLLSKADAVISQPMPANVTNEMAESVLNLAEKIWQARLAACPSVNSPDEEPVRLIMQEVAQ